MATEAKKFHKFSRMENTAPKVPYAGLMLSL